MNIEKKVKAAKQRVLKKEKALKSLADFLTKKLSPELAEKEWNDTLAEDARHYKLKDFVTEKNSKSVPASVPEFNKTDF